MMSDDTSWTLSFFPVPCHLSTNLSVSQASTTKFTKNSYSQRLITTWTRDPREKKTVGFDDVENIGVTAGKY